MMTLERIAVFLVVLLLAGLFFGGAFGYVLGFFTLQERLRGGSDNWRGLNFQRSLRGYAILAAASLAWLMVVALFWAIAHKGR